MTVEDLMEAAEVFDRDPFEAYCSTDQHAIASALRQLAGVKRIVAGAIAPDNSMAKLKEVLG